MTIATTTNRISYTGNGVTTLFAVPYTYYNASDLKVYVDGVLKTITTDYTVGSGGVTFVTAPASSKVVLIVREVPMTQTTDYKNFEPVDADELETNIDKLTILVQQADEKAARGINLDVTDSATSLTLPVTRANKVLAFDASGLPVASTKTLAQIEAGATDAAASAVAAAASASAALVSEINAAATYDAFDDRYLGQKASDPTVDNDGNTLLIGALYFNTVSNLMKVWNGSSWDAFNAITPPDNSITTAKIVNNAVTNAKLAQMATQTFKGRTTAGTGNAEDLTTTQATAMLNVFDSSNKGLAPASGGGTANFLRADGTWAVAGGSVNSQTFTASGTWTKPASGTMARIQIWAGGGGGGSTAGGGGGGGGGYAEIILPLSSLGATETVTIGAGGAINNAGGNSTFGSLLTAYAGGAQTGSSTGGGGGGGELSVGNNNTSTTLVAGGRIGGGDGGASSGAAGTNDSKSIHGGGGGAGNSMTNGGFAVYGGGGGGAAGFSGGTSKYGGNGGAGNSAGVAPAGGGGRNAAGARGECRVTVW